MDNSLVLFTIFLVCVWLLLDQFIGAKRIGTAASFLVRGNAT